MFAEGSGITVRMLSALVTAFVICIALLPTMIRRLVEKRIGQQIRAEGVETHKKKAGVPTMGGLLILIAVVVSVVFWTKPGRYVWMVLGGLVGLGLLGGIDDYLKVMQRQSKGLSARGKILGQVAVAAALGIYLYLDPAWKDTIYLPLVRWEVDLGVFYVPFVMFVVVGASNAVNLTDGLDGLATGVLTIVALSYAAIAYVAGNSIFSAHLGIPYVREVGELAIVCCAMVGACIGFLWYNTYPAAIFMGDTGSLALGGALGIVAVLVRHEMLLAIIGGIFVIEALSVIIQVASYKTTGKRVFLMAPIHHHFEKAGWEEPKVVIRFWIITLMLAFAGLSVLGLNTLLIRDEVEGTSPAAHPSPAGGARVPRPPSVAASPSPR